MINKTKIKNLAKKRNKKISKEALNEIGKILEEKAEELIIKAERKSDISGRKIIFKEDLN